MRSRALAIGVAGGVLALIVTASAPARRGHKFVVPAYARYAFKAKSSHGYKVSVSAEPTSFSSGGPPQMPEVDLRFRQRGSSAEYTVPAKISSDGFRARFGRLGEMSVRIASAGRVKPTVVSEICKREKATKQRVVFEGRIRFRGEHGFTRLRLHHARGTVTRTLRQSCLINFPANGGGHGAGGIGQPTLLEANWHGKRSELDFSAGTASGISAAFFSAARAEIREPMVVIRTVSDRAAKANTFSFDAALASATVMPPAPFSGQGTYSAPAGGGSGSWSGPLEVDFPGRPHTHLAGARFSATLSHGDPSGPGFTRIAP